MVLDLQMTAECEEVAENDLNDSDNEDQDEYDDEILVYDTFIGRKIESMMEIKLEPLRKIVNLFRKSTVKNNVLQPYVKVEFQKELELLLDVKTRWNSIETMVDRAFML